MPPGLSPWHGGAALGCALGDLRARLRARLFLSSSSAV
eukprot:CAMPEP_0119082586 /NCGR_PEP_ID=MMETSP1178-20130426/121948_1 /TAXON_ID=33656 /ORGANISM="unid sp, Strain CCMP2000" /LENGTH=37 /DNA_ID= /DNA_START= /DNA_END= /DNA_ORIENTATION=